MLATVETIADYIELLAPAGLALPGDPVGLQVGDRRAPVEKVLVALELDEAVLQEALRQQANLVVTHHPLLYRPLQAVDESLPAGALIASTIRNKINVYSAHTNLDTAPRGLNHLLAELIGLSAAGRRVIEVTGSDRLYKLVVFVPESHADPVHEALAQAGAGWIGAYSHCSFQARGTGTFMPREGTNPFIGSRGRLEKVEELRLETILPASRRRAVLEALLASHPYEEVAYDLYELAREGEPIGLGLIGLLDPPLSLEQLLQRCREQLDLSGLRYWAPPEQELYRQVAVCGGSGGALVETAAALGAELFISGDFRHHDFKNAVAARMGLVDAGHYGTERPVVTLLGDYLRERLLKDGYTTGVVLAGPAQSDWCYF